MNKFNYKASAELFPAKRRFGKSPVSYKRFSSAAAAIRYAMEDLPPDVLIGTYLEVDEDRFDHKGIAKLYRAETYPLKRRATAT
jgi:hypothetical protein